LADKEMKMLNGTIHRQTKKKPSTYEAEREIEKEREKEERRERV